MKNVVYCTTRQWNPGDEFILMGTQYLLEKVIGKHNPIIFNRNPQIRRARKYDFIKRIDNTLGKDFVEKFLDNSVKERTPMDYADIAVFAGSPEWRGLRTRKLYSSILEYKLPTLFMGLGTSSPVIFGDESFSEDEEDVFKQAKLITCRDNDSYQGLKELGAHQLPCPALFSSPEYRKVNKVKKIGILYGTASAVACNNISQDTYSFMMKNYRAILEKYSKDYEIEFVAHYIDELSEFQKDFPNETLRYSFDAKDYRDIFSEYDLIIGYRVHGIGMCASQGTPGIMIAHDPRASTVKGFLAEMVTLDTSTEDFIALIDSTINDISDKSEALLKHRHAVEALYLPLITKALSQ
ncbi:polysaccharide pyruvyl transferase family protein [Vibrio sp. ZSDZ65]|uniref:Polysaccharide pyruvyl transferase family protein n=1 Tax=Vibrio qingdaonensis TaxID=2829491 RepID=A0A9X3CR90_9VIBR|nr:polysaccharide pyruvyl transferase family protein [Vibrio qingdaonensis]MCW8348046.1 polysaccharide pyruvyl transferase family protein [Vibrio qingdaonensis]